MNIFGEKVNASNQDIVDYKPVTREGLRGLDEPPILARFLLALAVGINTQ